MASEDGDGEIRDLRDLAEATAARSGGEGVEKGEDGGGGASDGGGAAGDGDAGSEEEEEHVHAEGVTVMRSMCPACEEEGETRVLPTKIPFFREVVVVSFTCEECGHRNTTVQSATIQERGCYFGVEVRDARDLNRQILKSDTAAVRVPCVELEIPHTTQQGVFTTIEGMLDNVVQALEGDQVVRRAVDPDAAAAIDAFLDKIKALKDGSALPFVLELDDPAGNSFLENPHAPSPDPALTVKFYRRSRGQNLFLGLNPEEGAAAYPELEQVSSGEGGEEGGEGGGGGGGREEEMVEGVTEMMRGSVAKSETRGEGLGGGGGGGGGSGGGSGGSGDGDGVVVPEREKFGGSITAQSIKDGGKIVGQTGRAVATVRGPGMDAALFSRAEDGAKEMMTFPTSCSNCGHPGEVRMLMTDIPYFKDVILMSMRCDACGYRDVEVKGGGGTPAKGTIHVLRVGVVPCADGDGEGGGEERGGGERDVELGLKVLDAAGAAGLEVVRDTERLVEGGVRFDKAAAAEDLRRDVIKGDTATVLIPELEIALQPGTLGGVYTTVEGLLTSVHDRLRDANPFSFSIGDSADAEQRETALKFTQVLEKLQLAADSASLPFTLIVKDPMANSWIYSPLHPEPDPRLTEVEYTRSSKEDAELGIKDMDAPEDGVLKKKTEEEDGEGEEEGEGEEGEGGD